MSTVNFNDDLSLALPFGWGSKELREEGKRVLRIVGPGAGSYVSDSRDYPCDICLSVSKPVEKSIDDMDFPAKLKEISAKAPDIQISVSVSSSFGSSSTSRVGGSGFDWIHKVVTDEPSLKVGYFSMGIIGKTAYIGVVITEHYLYMLTTMKSDDLDACRRSFPEVLGGIELLHAPMTPEEREAQRLAREKAEQERLAREAEQRRKEAEAERERKKKEAEQKAAYDKAMADWTKKKTEVEKRRSSELGEQLARFENAEKAGIEKTWQERKQAAEAALAAAQQKEKQAQETLASLGFFRFGEKSEQKQRVQAAQAAAAEAQKALSDAEKTKSSELASLPRRVAEKKEKLTREIDAKYPLPTQPAKSAYITASRPRYDPAPSCSQPRQPTPWQTENAGFKADILAYMEPDTLYTAQDITNSVPSVAAAGLSGNRVTAMLTQLVNDGKLVKTIENRTAYYSLD